MKVNAALRAFVTSAEGQAQVVERRAATKTGQRFRHRVAPSSNGGIIDGDERESTEFYIEILL